MIKGINQGGRYLIVTGGQPGSNYVNNYSGAQGVGNMRFNTSNQNMEIWDGSTWLTLQNSYASISLDDEAIQLLDWAKNKRREEFELEKLSEENPAVKLAYENLKRAEEQLKITKILSHDEQSTS